MNKKRIQVLDVTLRDGGCVNDFNFGQTYMTKILSAAEAAQIDVIELGYLDAHKGSCAERTQYKDEQVIKSCLLHHKQPNTKYVAMMDLGKFDPDSLHPRTAEDIDGIRLAFHKKDVAQMFSIGRTILSKGYELYIQPMLTLRYSEEELLSLIQRVNTELADASGFYIVDSFGEMRPLDLHRLLQFVDTHLLPEMTMGFHSHNNLQMSYSNACSLLDYTTNRPIMVDSSIMGMGKGAGNLNTELLLEHLNLYYNGQYQISPLLEVIDKVINQLHSEYYWGYAPEYYLSSANHCTPSYASHFYNKHMLPIDQVGELLSLIPEDKKISFDAKFAEELYRNYNASLSVDDTTLIDDLQKRIHNKRILLIAPGKNAECYREQILAFAKMTDVFTIGLNLTGDFPVDIMLTTRQDLLEGFIKQSIPIVTTTNVSKGLRGSVGIVNYGRWIEVDEQQTHDSSSVIAFNILRYCGAKDIYLAGFDGFSVNINDNYFDKNMRHPVTEEQAIHRNSYYTRFIARMQEQGIKITFITPSKLNPKE